MRKTAITPTRGEDFPTWYQMVIKEADLAENSKTKGCMIIKPWGYGIWERIQNVLDGMIKKEGHKNVYFPLFIPISFFEKEASHVEGFAKECAVVTHHRLEKKGDKLIPAGELTEPYVVRPTSEMIIGEAFSRWVQSYRDLPILINQWANIVRWEMRTRMFLRTTEFLWQEGHTAHRSKEEAIEETLKMLDLYEKFAEHYLAMPVLKGKKSEREKFPGAENTYTIEAMMQDKKALQAGTSHFLGQNFAKASDIKFKDEDGEDKFVWTTSWGMSTRLIGALIMAHSDDDGVVLPPKIAPTHVVLQPIENKKEIIAYCDDIKNQLEKTFFEGSKVEVFVDDRDIRGGDKKWEWIKKGVPIRVEIGKRELKNNEVSFFRRDELKRRNLNKENFILNLPSILSDMQKDLLEKARKFREDNTIDITTEKEFYDYFSEGGGFAFCYFSEDDMVEEKIKRDLNVTIRCIPNHSKDDRGNCFFTNKENCKKMIFAKAY